MDEWSDVGICSQLNITPDFEHVMRAIVRIPFVHTELPQSVTLDHVYIYGVGFWLFVIVIGWMDWSSMHPSVFQLCDPRL